MSNKVKFILIGLISLIIGFGFFTGYAYAGKGIIGIIAMVFVFGGVYFFVRAFSSENKK